MGMLPKNRVRSLLSTLASSGLAVALGCGTLTASLAKGCGLANALSRALTMSAEEELVDVDEDEDEDEDEVRARFFLVLLFLGCTSGSVGVSLNRVELTEFFE